MRVAYLLPPIGKPDGWRSHTLGLLEAISQDVEPVLFVAEEDAETAAWFFPQHPRYTLPIIQYPYLRTPNYRKLAASAAAILRLGEAAFPEIDLVHSLEGYPAGLLGHLLANRLRKPHLITLHGSYAVLPYHAWLHRTLYRQVLKRAAALCPVSPQTGDFVKTYFQDAVANTVIHPILNGNTFYKMVPRQEALSRRPACPPAILSVGALKQRKGYHISLEAFARLKRLLPPARYWIAGAAGDQRYYRQLKSIIARHQLEGVSLMGPISDETLRTCYREASVFLLTPVEENLHFEGFGLVYLEAGAFGLPAVGVRTGGVPSAIRHGETGFLVDPADIQGLVEVLHRLLVDEGLARRIGLANREWAETLTWERNAAEHLGLYQDLLHSEPQAAYA